MQPVHFVCALLLASAISGGAAAQALVEVTGWQKSAPQKVVVFDKDGRPHKDRIDRATASVAGLREFNADYEIVQLAGDKWVRSIDLDLIFCKQIAGAGAVAPGRGGRVTGMTMGSGGKCP